MSTIKHAHHKFDVDKPGKDSYEHRQAGATEVMVSSGNRWALMHELRDEAEPDLEQLIAKMSPVDLLLVEGFKHGSHAKVEVYRPSNGNPVLAPDDPNVMAVATDGDLPDAVTVPRLDMNDVAAVADFILDYVGLGEGRRDLGTANG